MNDKEIRQFFAQHIQPSVPEIPQEITVVTFNPSSFAGRGGIRILQLKIPFRKGEIKAFFGSQVWRFNLKNIRRFQFYEIANRRNAESIPTDGIILNGQSFSKKDLTDLFSPKFTFLWNGSSYEISRDGETFMKRERSPSNYGPGPRQVSHGPFLIVIGTNGTPHENDVYLQLALYIASQHFIAAETLVQIVKDQDLTEEVAKSHNLLLIGTLASNSWMPKLTQIPAYQFIETDNKTYGLRLGSCLHQGAELGYLLTFPWNGNKLAVVISGSDLQGLKNIVLLASPTIPPMTRSPFTNLLPDFVVTGSDIKKKGTGGFLSAGFLGNFWDYLPEIIYNSC